jgi:pimeloyl-ACP methyl ester carboxylesterase
MESIKTFARHVAAALGVTLAMAGGAQAQNTVGTGFPPGFWASMDAHTGAPWFGFGAAGPVTRTPVIFLHGNGGTPYHDTSTCAQYGADIQRMAQYFADNGYSTSELWALGWQGKQCEFTPLGLPVPAYNASMAHSIGANVEDLRNFVRAVLKYTGAPKVDIVAHDTGVVLVREWVRQDSARRLVRRFVAIDGPNQGLAICSNVAGNPWASSGMGGFTPDSALCEELGSPNTPFLKTLNKAVDGQRISSPDTFVIRNGDSSFPFFPRYDGVLVQGAPGINANSNSVLDIYRTPTDFTTSPSIPRNSNELVLTGQHGWASYGGIAMGTAHVGIANSAITWQAALDFIRRK